MYKKTSKKWTEQEILILKEKYPNTKNRELSKIFKRHETEVSRKARSLKLIKCGSAEYFIKIRVLQPNQTLQDMRIYKIWGNMKTRCGPNKSDPKTRKHYYDKGIRVCDEWSQFINFYNWSMDNGYNNRLTIDRIDGEKDYSPKNCRWVTQNEQLRNTSQNKNITAFSETKSLIEWSEDPRCVVCYDTLRTRINTSKLTAEECITRKKQRGKKWDKKI